MARVLTEEDKDAIRQQQLKHWARCELWAEVLDVDKCEINAHWSCCIKDACGRHLSTNKPSVPRQLSVRKAYADCLLRQAKTSHQLADQHYAHARKSPQEITFNEMVKIMKWAIKKCGARRAKSAFAYACEDMGI